MKEKELIIIGSGPAGLKAAQEAKKLEIDYIILEKGDVAQAWRDIRGDMPMLSPCHPQRDWTSISSQFPIWKLPVTRPYCAAHEFVQYLIAFCHHFDLNISTHTRVERLSKVSDNFIIETSQGTYCSRAVYVSTGFFGNPYIPSIPNLRNNPIVMHSHHYVSRELFRNKRVVIIGAGNSGAEIAIALSGSSQVFLVTRSNLKYFSKTNNLCHIRGISESFLRELIKMEIIRHISNVNIKNVEGNLIHLSNRTIETHHIICATGYRPVLDVLKGFQVEVDGKSKFPLIKESGEAQGINNLFFGGPLAYMGLRSLFIHGFIRLIPDTIKEIQERIKVKAEANVT